MKQKFLICEKCKAMVAVVKDCTCENCGIKCCGEQMKPLKLNSFPEKSLTHKPVVTKNKNVVKVIVGQNLHEMNENHFIQWISIETKEGNQRKELKQNQKPEATFFVDENDVVINAYAYCNNHGLWNNNETTK